MSNCVGSLEATKVIANVVVSFSSRPITVISPAAESTCVVIEIAGFCVESVMFAMAVDNEEVRIYKARP